MPRDPHMIFHLYYKQQTFGNIWCRLSAEAWVGDPSELSGTRPHRTPHSVLVCTRDPPPRGGSRSDSAEHAPRACLRQQRGDPPLPRLPHAQRRGGARIPRRRARRRAAQGRAPHRARRWRVLWLVTLFISFDWIRIYYGSLVRFRFDCCLDAF